MEGYDKTQDGLKVNNIPGTGMATGKYFTDSYGCWWEYIMDDSGKRIWIIGLYPQ